MVMLNCMMIMGIISREVTDKGLLYLRMVITMLEYSRMDI